MEEQIRTSLREAVLESDRIRRHLEELHQEIGKQGNALALQIGSRDALAKLILPEGVTLAKAWDDDLNGLRTGGEGEPE